MYLGKRDQCSGHSEVCHLLLTIFVSYWSCLLCFLGWDLQCRTWQLFWIGFPRWLMKCDGFYRRNREMVKKRREDIKSKHAFLGPAPPPVSNRRPYCTGQVCHRAENSSLGEALECCLIWGDWKKKKISQDFLCPSRHYCVLGSSWRRTLFLLGVCHQCMYDKRAHGSEWMPECG